VDNTDINTHTYQGFDGYTVFDARVRYRVDRHWSAALGVDNLTNRDYFLFHPFPQRTVFAELKYDFDEGGRCCGCCHVAGQAGMNGCRMR
jgi:iron complex outermembrane receptor protein